VVIFCQDVVFTSPNEAVNFGVQNSQIYLLQKQSALQNMKLAKFSFQDFLPTLSLSFSETDSIAMLVGDTRTKSIQATISQEIFDGGKKKLAYEINRISSLYAYQEYESSLHNFRSEIISQYYQYLIQLELTSIKESLASTARDQLQIIEKEVELGITLETDYLEYLISFIQIENDKDQSRRDLKTLERKFKSAIGLHEQARFLIDDKLFHDFTYFYYEPYTDFIWKIIRNVNTEIKKQNISLEYSKKQLVYSRRWYIPSLSVQGGITFTGDNYPLTEPKYSFKLLIDFNNLGFLPANISNGYGFDRDHLYNVNNSLSVNLLPSPAYGVQQKLADISLLQTNIQRMQTEKDIHESVFDIITNHDNNLRIADAAERTIKVMEKRIEFSRHEVDVGEKKRIDYLEELITLSQTRISLLQYHGQAAALERGLEILSNFSFGDLKDACLQQ
jgi:outer membrane protein TolC